MSIDFKRITQIGLTVCSIYLLIFVLFVGLSFMHNDVSIANTIIAAQFALLCTAFAGCAGYLGARINYENK